MTILKDRCMERMIAHNLHDQLRQLAKLKKQDEAIAKLDKLITERRVRKTEVPVDRRKKDATPL